MTWPAIVCLYVLLQLAGSFWTKLVSMSDARGERLVWQYLFCLIYSVSGALWQGDYSGGSWFLMFILGTLNALACYSSWRVFELSLGGGGALLQTYSFVAIIFGVVFLGEWRLIFPLRTAGVLVCVAILLNVIGTLRIVFVDEAARRLVPRLFFWGGIVIAIWGVTTAVLRYQAASDSGVFSTLMYWYAGSLMGALLLRRVGFSTDTLTSAQANSSSIGSDDLSRFSILGVASYSAYLIINICMVYWLFETLPLSYAQPILNGVQVIAPFLVGAGFFGERALISRAAIIGLALILGSQFLICFGVLLK